MTAPHTQCQPEAAPVRQPTATPWRVHGLYPEEIYATDDGHRYMVTEVCGAGTTEQDKANAAFIVEAVNSHAALKSRVEELTKALEKFSGCWDVVRGGWNYSSLDYALKEARSALSLERQQTHD